MKKQTHDIKQFFSSRIFLLIALVIAILFALGFARAYYKDYKVKQEIHRLETELSSLEKKKIESFELLKYVSSDVYVEDRARTELNMKKAGEHVLILNTQGGYSVPSTKEDINTGQMISNPIKWLYYFIHKPLVNSGQ